MNMNLILRAATPLIVAGVLVAVPTYRGFAESPLAGIAVGRAEIKAGRMAVVAEALQLTDEQGKSFWPLYREYWAAMDEINDGLVKVVLEYADVYPDVPEDRAGQLLKDYTALEKKRAATREAYLRKVAKTITAAKALRLAQVENRLDLTVRLQLAGAIPLVPVRAE